MGEQQHCASGVDLALCLVPFDRICFTLEMHHQTVGKVNSCIPRRHYSNTRRVYTLLSKAVVNIHSIHLPLFHKYKLYYFLFLESCCRPNQLWPFSPHSLYKGLCCDSELDFWHWSGTESQDAKFSPFSSHFCSCVLLSVMNICLIKTKILMSSTAALIKAWFITQDFGCWRQKIPNHSCHGLNYRS